MLDLVFAAIPFVITFGAVGAVSLSYLKCLPRSMPEVVLVRAPFGFSENNVRKEMRIHEMDDRFRQGPLYYLKFPITDQKSTERAMTEIANRLPFHRGYLSSPWFVIHAPNIDSVSLLEVLLITHGYTVNVLEFPPPTTEDGFPSKSYFEWAERCPFVKHKEDMIQLYFDSW